MTIDLNDPFQTLRSMEGPAWRWKLAVQQFAFPTDGVDDTVKAAASYIELLTSREDQGAEAASTFPLIVAAKSLWDQPETRRQLTILVLGNHPSEQIATRLAIAPEIIQVTEQLFLDIRDCREAPGWINAHIIRPESNGGSKACAVQYRAAYWGGPQVASQIIDMEASLPLDEVQRLADQETRLYMKMQQALEFPLECTQDSLQYLKIVLDFRTQTDRLELAKKKFQQHCEQAARRYELAARRLAAAAKREESRMAQRAQRSGLVMQRAKELKMQFDAAIQRNAADEALAARRVRESPLARLQWIRHEKGSVRDVVQQRAAPVPVENIAAPTNPAVAA